MSRIDIVEVDGLTCELHTPSKSQPPSISPEFDLEDYRADIADLGMTREQEAEFLQTLWSIMGHFARLGHSVDVCGLIFEEFNEASDPAVGTGNLMPSTNQESASETNGGSA